MSITTPSAILLGFTMTAAAIYLKPMPATATHYQVTSFGAGLVARLDVSTGAIDLCGSIQSVLPLMQRIVPYAPNRPDLDDLEKVNVQMALDTRCLTLTNRNQ